MASKTDNIRAAKKAKIKHKKVNTNKPIYLQEESRETTFPYGIGGGESQFTTFKKPKGMTNLSASGKYVNTRIVYWNTSKENNAYGDTGYVMTLPTKWDNKHNSTRVLHPSEVPSDKKKDQQRFFNLYHKGGK